MSKPQTPATKPTPDALRAAHSVLGGRDYHEAAVTIDLEMHTEAWAELLEVASRAQRAIRGLALRLDKQPGNQIAVGGWLHEADALLAAIERVRKAQGD